LTKIHTLQYYQLPAGM